MVNCLLFLIAYRGSSLCFFRIPLYTLCLPSKFEKLLFSTVLEVSSPLRNIWKQQPMQTVFLTGDSKIENFGTSESLYCPLGQAWYSPLISYLCTVTGLKQLYHPIWWAARKSPALATINNQIDRWKNINEPSCVMLEISLSQWGWHLKEVN